MRLRNVCIVLLLILLMLILLILFKRFYPVKQSRNYTIIDFNPIPKVINKIYIQHSGNLLESDVNGNIQLAHNSWIQNNPGYTLKLWSLDDCRDYLYSYFPRDYLEAFDCLNAYACKADFFRCCIIYKEGGWYSDWKQECLKEGMLDDYQNNDIVLFWDSKGFDASVRNYISNGFFGAKPKSLFLKDCINQIINNVKNKKYFENSLVPTGPGLWGEMYKHCNYEFSLFGSFDKFDFYCDKNLNRIIKHKIDDTGGSQDWQNGNNYNILWNSGKFYSDFDLKLYENKIPKIIYKTGPFQKYNLPESVTELYEKIKENNPSFEFVYFDNEDCEEFISNNYDNEVLEAYNSLNPTAYKADLFRYCLLYKNGGIYSDFSQNFLKPLDELISFEKDQLVLCDDIPQKPYKFGGVQISFMAAAPNLDIYKKCIDTIVLYCKNKTYQKNPLDITGPYLFKRILNTTDINYRMELSQIRDKAGIRDEYLVLKKFAECNKSAAIKTKLDNHTTLIYKSNTPINYYDALWYMNNVYKELWSVN